MFGKNTAVFGMYRDRIQAEDAVDRLLPAGFRREDIAVLLADNRGSKDFAHLKGTKAPEGLAAGSITGGILGTVIAWLTAEGIVVTSGLDPLVAAGPVVAALAGLGAGGAFGGIIGAIIGMTNPEYEARRFKGRIKRSGVLLSIHCDNSDWVRRAKAMLRQTGAEAISTEGECDADYENTDKPLPRRRVESEYFERLGILTDPRRDRVDQENAVTTQTPGL
jgi:hypothetical protein